VSDIAAARKTVEALIRDVPDFPKPGILFKDLTPVLASPAALEQAVQGMSDPFRNERIDHVVGIEARGFVFGAPAALALNAGFIPVRKPGKLPHETASVTYDLEYGTDTLEIHLDGISPGERVLIVDDLLATGGTAAAAIELVAKTGAELVGISFLVELAFLEGRKRLSAPRIESLVRY
jgi:adenine phosphoribosyltransferase